MELVGCCLVVIFSKVADGVNNWEFVWSDKRTAGMEEGFMFILYPVGIWDGIWGWGRCMDSIQQCCVNGMERWFRAVLRKDWRSGMRQGSLIVGMVSSKLELPTHAN